VGFAEWFHDIALQLARFTQVYSMAKTRFIFASPSHPIYVYKKKHTNTHTHTVDGRIPAPPTGWLKPINNGMFTTFQRVQDFFHPQYHNL
jgi:hypothetical protein